MCEERGAGRKKEGEGATGDGEKREGDGGKDIELRRRPEGAKHDESSQPSNRRLPAHNDKQASGSGERGPESLAKQLEYGELQGEREGEGVTSDGKKRATAARTLSSGASLRGPSMTRAASPATGAYPPTTTCRQAAQGSAPLRASPSS